MRRGCSEAFILKRSPLQGFAESIDDGAMVGLEKRSFPNV